MRVGLKPLWSCQHGIKTGIKESTEWYPNYDASHLLIFGGYVKVTDFLYVCVIIWGDIVLNRRGREGEGEGEGENWYTICDI
jgi:hypothetical protein